MRRVYWIYVVAQPELTAWTRLQASCHLFYVNEWHDWDMTFIDAVLLLIYCYRREFFSSNLKVLIKHFNMGEKIHLKSEYEIMIMLLQKCLSGTDSNRVLSFHFNAALRPAVRNWKSLTKVWISLCLSSINH